MRTERAWRASMHAGAISRANEAKRGVSEEIEPMTEKPKDLVAFFDDHHDVSAAMSKSRSILVRRGNKIASQWQDAPVSLSRSNVSGVTPRA